jgi:hypothetical protein
MKMITWCYWAEGRVKQTKSGRYVVDIWAKPVDNVLTFPPSKRVYCPKSCTDEQEAVNWAHHQVFEKFTAWYEGAQLLADVKKKFGSPENRKLLFGDLCQRLEQEFDKHWLYTNKEAQQFVRNLLKV